MKTYLDGLKDGYSHALKIQAFCLNADNKLLARSWSEAELADLREKINDAESMGTNGAGVPEPNQQSASH